MGCTSPTTKRFPEAQEMSRGRVGRVVLTVLKSILPCQWWENVVYFSAVVESIAVLLYCIALKCWECIAVLQRATDADIEIEAVAPLASILCTSGSTNWWPWPIWCQMEDFDIWGRGLIRQGMIGQDMIFASNKNFQRLGEVYWKSRPSKIVKIYSE